MSEKWVKGQTLSIPSFNPLDAFLLCFFDSTLMEGANT